MKGKLAFAMLFVLLAGYAAYAASSQPVVAHTFTCTGSPALRSGPCPEGGRPGVLMQGSDGNFYGTAQVSMEGTSEPNGGTVFSITPGGKLTVLHTFGPGANKNYPKGNLPSSLVEGPDGKLYGITLFGGVGGCNGYCGSGVLYRMGKTGTGFQILHKFCSVTGCTDGGEGALVVGSDGNLYGSSATGGTGNCGQFYQGCGTIFRVTPSTGAYEVVVNFSGTTDEFPSGLTLASDGTLYGTDFGGSAGIQLFHFTPSTGAFQTVALNFPMFNGLPSRPASDLTVGANGNFYGLYHIYAHCCEGLFEVQPDGSNLKLLPTDNTLKVASGLLLGSDGNFWTLEYNGGNGYGAILAISPSQGTVVQTRTPFGASAPVGAYPAWLIQLKDGTFEGSAAQYGKQAAGNFADGTVYNLNLGLPPR